MFKELFQTSNKVNKDKGIAGITGVSVSVTSTKKYETSGGSEDKSLNKDRSKKNLKNKFSSIGGSAEPEEEDDDEYNDDEFDDPENKENA